MRVEPMELKQIRITIFLSSEALERFALLNAERELRDEVLNITKPSILVLSSA